MKQTVGSAGVYGDILPKASRIAKIPSISKKAYLRLKWIDHYRHISNNIVLTCRHFGISRSLFYKWYDRWQRLGLKGLENQSTKPHTFRKREISWEIQKKIIKIRKDNPAWSKTKISVILKRDDGILISPSSVNRIFHDRGLFWSTPGSIKRATRKHWQIRRERATKGLRGAAPGSLVEVDLKVLNNLGKTFYQFTAIDTCTKIKFLKIYSSKKAFSGQLFFQEMLDYYPFRIRHINSDNGGEFLAEAHEYLEQLKITHYFSRPQTPKDNPMVERTIQSDEYEFWSWGNLTTTVKELDQAACYWMDKFNFYRPHQALGYLTPMEYYETNYLHH